MPRPSNILLAAVAQGAAFPQAAVGFVRPANPRQTTLLRPNGGIGPWPGSLLYRFRPSATEEASRDLGDFDVQLKAPSQPSGPLVD